MDRNTSRDRKPFINALVLFIMLAAALLAGAFSGPDAAGAVISPGSASGEIALPLSSSSGCVIAEGNICEVDIIVQSKDQPVSGVQVYLDFDADSLEVEDDNLDKDGIQIQAGSAFPASLDNSVDNNAGHINFSAGKLGGPYETEDILVATVRFRVKSAPPAFDGRITVSTESPRDTVADYQGTPLLSSKNLADGSFGDPSSGPTQITLPHQTTLTIQVDSVTLRLVPDTSSSTTEKRVSVVVEGDNVSKIAGLQFEVHFDPTKVQVVDEPGTEEVEGIAKGDLPEGFLFASSVDNSEGVASVVTGRATPIGGSAGSVTVAEITFVLAAGASGQSATLSFHEVVISDEQSKRLLAYEAEDASITIGGLPTVAFVSGNPTGGTESSTRVNLSVRLSTASTQAVTVRYSDDSIQGTATRNVDYRLLGAGTLIFASGQTTRDISIDIINDGQVESNETIVVRLSNPDNATLGSPITHTYTILDNDTVFQPPPVGGGGVPQITPTPTPTRTPGPTSRLSSPTPTPRPQPTAVPLSEQVRRFITEFQAGQVTPRQAAGQLRQFGAQNAAQVVSTVAPGDAAEVFAELDAQFAAQVANLLEASAVADIAARMPPDRAAVVLDGVSSEALAETIEIMDEDALLQRLPEMSPGRMFRVPARLLLDRLPGMPVEQLTAETVPQADPGLPSLTALQVSPGLTTYSIPQTGESAWTRLAGGPTFLERMLGKFSRAIANVTVQVEELTEPPAAVPDLGAGMAVERFFRVDVENASPEDMLAVHMALSVSKSWLQSNGIHKWSVQLARFDEEHGQWVLFPTKRVDENQERVLYTVVAPGFSLLAVVGSEAVPPPSLEVADLSLSPTLPLAGDAVTVSVRVRATGSEPGVYPVSLWIDDTIEQVTTVALEPGQIMPVSFTVYRPEGSYRVRVGRVLGQMDIGPAVAGVQVENPSAADSAATTSSTPDPFGAAASEATPAPVSTPPPGAPSEGKATDNGGGPNTLIFIIVGVVVGLAGIAFAAQYVVSRR